MSDLALKVAIVLACALGGIATTVIFKMENDNPIEQLAEKIIKKHTGIKIDLSPFDGYDPDDIPEPEIDSDK